MKSCLPDPFGTIVFAVCIRGFSQAEVTHTHTSVSAALKRDEMCSFLGKRHLNAISYLEYPYSYCKFDRFFFFISVGETLRIA